MIFSTVNRADPLPSTDTLIWRWDIHSWWMRSLMYILWDYRLPGVCLDQMRTELERYLETPLPNILWHSPSWGRTRHLFCSCSCSNTFLGAIQDRYICCEFATLISIAYPFILWNRSSNLGFRLNWACIKIKIHMSLRGVPCSTIENRYVVSATKLGLAWVCLASMWAMQTKWDQSRISYSSRLGLWLGKAV